MKQSKKLLSIFLAMLMLIGTVSVVGNAAVARDDVAYDSMDNAVLTPEQVATIILDSLDRDVMPGLGVVIDENIMGVKIKLDLSSINSALTDIYSLLTNSTLVNLAGGDVKTIAGEIDRLKYNGSLVQRSKDNDIQIFYCLLDFLMNEKTAEVLSRAPYGILKTGGIEAGSLIQTILGMFVNLDDINKIVMNLDDFATTMVYDMLIYGSYGYDKDSEELGGSLPSTANTIDKILATAVTTLLTKPQKYTYVNGVKTWDEDSKILNITDTELKQLDLSLANNSIITILDKALPIAYKTFGTVVLNHDLKKIFMEALGADFVEVEKGSEEYKKIIADGTGYIDPDGSNSAKVKNYFCNAQMWKVDGTWYFRDYVTRPVLDDKGNLQYKTDENGNQVVVEALQHRYQRAETYNADSLFNLVNWDYYFEDDTIDFNTLISNNGSLIGSLNDLLNIILNQALNLDGLNKILSANGEPTVASVNAIWAPGGLDHFNENLMSLAGILLKNFTFMFFGRNPAYVDLNTFKATADFKNTINTFITNDDREGLIAYMLLPFLGDALPQLIYDLDMFTPGVQIEQTAALLVREFLSDLAPQINYDDQIFVPGSLTSKEGRKFQTKDSAQWMELILNMGLDLAAVYLDNISSFNVDLNTLEEIKSYAVAAGDPAYMGVLEEIVDWAIDYISDGQDYSVIKGLEPGNAEKGLNSVRCVTSYNDKKDTVTVANNYAGNAFDIVSTALNKLLPLGMLVGCSSDKHALDVQLVFNTLINFVDDFDLEVLLGVFGRTGRTDSLLEATNIPVTLLNVVNGLTKALFGNAILVADATVAEPINNALQQASLKTTIYNLLTGLNDRKVSLLRSALPLVALFISDFGGEQRFKAPGIDVDSVVTGTGEKDFTIKNKSYGIWRSYMGKNATTGEPERKYDEHYNLIIEKVAAYNYDGTASSYVTISDQGTGTFAYGTSSTVKYNVNSIPAEGAIVRFDVTYKMTGSDGNTALTTESSTVSKYMWLNAEGGMDFNNLAEPTRAEAYDSTYSDCKVVAYGGTYLIDTSNDAIIAQLDGFKGYEASKSKASSIGGKAREITCKVNGDATQFGITAPATFSQKIKEEVKTVYGNYSVTNPELLLQSDGGVASWSYECIAENKTASNSLTFYFYNGTSLNKLRSLVDSEMDMTRLPTEYNTSSDEWKAYQTAFLAAVRGAKQNMNASSVLNYTALYNALDAAVDNVENAKVSTANDVSKYIDALKETVNSVNIQIGGANFRTYAMYRWYKFNDLRTDANNMINLYERAQATAPDTKFFPYNDISEFDLKKLVSGNKYESYILALLENMSEDDLARAREDYRNAKKDLANLQASSISDTNDMLAKSVNRLLPRSGGVVNTYLINEINSAVAVIGRSNTAGYSTRSWNAYTTALDYAERVKNSTSQDTMFDAKYQLQVARNNLILAADEAYYGELDTLIAQAKQALTMSIATDSPYVQDNAAFGGILAALGYTTENGDVIIPGGALEVQATPYSAHDQDEIDDAADELKKALSKVKFEYYDIEANGGTTGADIRTGETDKDGNPVTEKVNTIEYDPESLVSLAKKNLGWGEGTTVAVSLDERYTATGSDNGNELLGTGATITVLKTTESGVQIPLATMKVIVKGDISGDGVIDVIDCSIAELVKNQHSDLTGVYYAAADVVANTATEIDADDFAEIVNRALA